MSDRRIGHQLFHVVLHDRDQTDVDHGNQRQRDHQAGQAVRGVRRDRQREAQETVGAQLQHDRGQHDGATRGRFHVGVRQPRVNRPHRHLDRESREQRHEDQDLRGIAQLGLLPGQDVERTARDIPEVDERDQRQQRTHQGVQEELERRIHAVRSAPDTDDDVHRDQRGFEEHVEQHAVQRAEHAHHQTRQDQEGGHVLRDAARDDFPAGQHHDDGDERGQEHEPHRNAVDAQVVIDVEGLDPGGLLHELHGGRGGIEPGVERNRDQEAGDRADERQAARQAGTVVTAHRQHQQAEYDRDKDRKREPGKSVGCHLACHHWGISTKKVTSAMTPMIIANA